MRSSAAGDRGEDRDGVAVLERRVEGAGEPDVLVIDVDVDETVQAALIGDEPALEARVAAVQVVNQGRERVALGVDGLGATGVGAQDGRDLDLDGHGLCSSWVRYRTTRGVTPDGASIVPPRRLGAEIHPWP